MKLPPFLRSPAKILSRPGMQVWSLLVRAGMRVSRPGSKVSVRARLLVLALRGYRFWSSFNPRDQVRIRSSQNALAARIRTAPGVRFAPVRAGGVDCEWAIPRGDQGDRAILYFHGGGYTTGSLVTHRSLVSYIAAASGIRVLGVDYRLAPEHPHPAAFEDALTAYRWLVGQGYPGPKLALAGDSAGGGLAMSLLLHLRDERLRGGTHAATDGLPAGAALLSPWVDLTDMKGSWERLAANDWLLTPESLQADARKYLGIPDAGCGDLVDPAVSPRYADMHGIPMLMVHVGGDELLREDILAFVAKARSDGVSVCLGEWAGMFHDWHMLAAYLPEARRAVDEIGTFLKIVLA